MHLVEQFRHTLNFIDDHPILVIGGNAFSQPVRPCNQGRVDLVIEQVEEQGPAKLFVKPCCLAHSTRPEQEETLP